MDFISQQDTLQTKIACALARNGLVRVQWVNALISGRINRNFPDIRRSTFVGTLCLQTL